jgi:hypothetical protein
MRGAKRHIEGWKTQGSGWSVVNWLAFIATMMRERTSFIDQWVRDSDLAELAQSYASVPRFEVAVVPCSLSKT